MGTVFLGHAPSGRDVAIKVIHEQYAGDPVFRTRFRQEVAAARRVSGAFTAAVVDADPEARRPWMATQYVPGPTLADRLRDQGPVQGGELRRLALGLAEALGDIHRAGVVHRDLKPANVLMAADGPRVIDFGISRAAENQALTATGHVMGTPPFMSPEQLNDPRSTGTASDVFSLAALLVYAVRGKGPFDADSPYLTAYRVVNEVPELDGVPQPLREVVAGCLAKEPGQRPALDVVAHALRRLPERTAKTMVWPAAGDQQTLTIRSTPASGPRTDTGRAASDAGRSGSDAARSQSGARRAAGDALRAGTGARPPGGTLGPGLGTGRALPPGRGRGAGAPAPCPRPAPWWSWRPSAPRWPCSRPTPGAAGPGARDRPRRPLPRVPHCPRAGSRGRPRWSAR
ncbi:serine/threonine-protein kinase, partial [Streptomyces sp. N35]|uniref:serine/threonine-protein kinase n=1 Tax=Streptomyces sp. N35 TaxID=2795730 RepID=UPI001F4601FD